MLTYSIITPARDEAGTLPALALALAEQTVRPLRWVIVEGGSSDATGKVAEEIDAKYDWAQLIVLPATGPRERGAPIVRALHAGLDALDGRPDVVVNVDADVTMEGDYFTRLLDAFARDPVPRHRERERLGAGGGEWRQRFVTGGTVWGATRAYRWACLQDVLPLEERHGWDGIDQSRHARAAGQPERSRIYRSSITARRAVATIDVGPLGCQRRTSYFMGYRPWYLIARTLHRLRRDPCLRNAPRLRVCRSSALPAAR